jgi:hypothetical protein
MAHPTGAKRGAILYYRAQRRANSPPQCTHCGADEVVRVVRRLRDWEAGEAGKRGEIVLGGCCVSGDDPKWFCRDCGWAWNAHRGEQWARA